VPALPAINNLRTTLSAPLDGTQTTADVAVTLGFPDQGVFSVEDEIIFYTGRLPTQFTGLTRGYDGSLAVPHANGLLCNLRIVAKHLNDAAFINPDPTPVDIGGIPAGTTFPDRTSVQEIMQQLLYPYQYPAFTAFGILGVTGPFEVGDTLSANLTFLWTTSNPSNIQYASLDLYDLSSGSVLLASGLVDDGSEPVVLAAPITYNYDATHTFRIDGLNTEPATFSGLLGVRWFWRLHYGNSANPTLSSAQILALSSSMLTGTIPRTYAMPAGGYKYICCHAGMSIQTIKDASTGFNVPTADTSDDPTYSSSENGLNYAIVVVTNAFGVVANYRVYRTKNSLGGAINLVVT
jgi:hypothetical protein